MTRPARAHYSLPSLIAIGAAIGSFFVGAGSGLVLAVVAIVAGVIGFVLALLPGIRGGIISILSILGGVIGIVLAALKLVI
jgi:hypothetical protein